MSGSWLASAGRQTALCAAAWVGVFLVNELQAPPGVTAYSPTLASFVGALLLGLVAVPIVSSRPSRFGSALLIVWGLVVVQASVGIDGAFWAVKLSARDDGVSTVAVTEVLRAWRMALPQDLETFARSALFWGPLVALAEVVTYWKQTRTRAAPPTDVEAKA